MRKASVVGTSVILVCTLLSGARADEPKPDRPKALAHEPLDIGPEKRPSADEQREIETSIALLTKLSHGHGGLTGMVAGGPYFEARNPWFGIREADADQADRAFVSLVKSGPSALPALLAHLNDTTPTALKESHGGGFGGMWWDEEFDWNPADDFEFNTLRAVFAPPADTKTAAPKREEPSRDITEHLVTVGDVCFVIVGQISNRAYQAVRGQPTACIVINSPTLTPRLSRAVAALWKDRDPRAELARRLMIDMNTPGDQRHRGGAILRLASYYPAAFAPILTKMLDQVEAEQASADQPEVMDLIEAATPGPRPEIRAALVRVALRTRSDEVFVAIVGELPEERAETLLASARRLVASALEIDDAFDRFQRLIDLVKSRWPSEVSGIVEGVLLKAGPRGARAVVCAFQDAGAPVPASAWLPFLDVHEPATDERSPSGPLAKLRLCDAAALQIVAARPELIFDAQLDEVARDKQLDALKKALAAGTKK